MKRLFIAASILIGLSSPAQAADYFLVVPVKGRAAAATPISVSLNTYTLPSAVEGVPYSFDLKPLLSVTGDPAYAGDGVTWSTVSSTLPAGLQLLANGLIAGTPIASGTGVLTARASYKTKSGEQSYSLVVASANKTLVLQAGGYRTWSDSSLATSCAAYLSPGTGYSYSGSTGSGVYRVKPAGGVEKDVFCDMTSDGGGWTLVMRAPAGATNTAQWLTTGELSRASILTAAPTSLAGKMADAEMKTYLVQAYRITTSFAGVSRTRFVKPSCNFSQTSAPAGDCLVTYAALDWSGALVSNVTGSTTARGIMDSFIVSPGYAKLYVQTGDSRLGSSAWYAGDGTGTTFGVHYGDAGASSIAMWVR